MLTIHGELRADRSFENEVIYLLPMGAGAGSAAKDSAVVQQGTFTFSVSADTASVRMIRPQNVLLTYFLQPLLVVIEPGRLEVRLDSVSSVTEGTPQNMALQQWKERKQKSSEQFSFYRKQWQEAADTTARAAIETDWKARQKEDADYTFTCIKENKENVLGRFLYEQSEGLLTPEQKEALNMPPK
jgi:hypothetical protein